MQATEKIDSSQNAPTNLDIKESNQIESCINNIAVVQKYAQQQARVNFWYDSGSTDTIEITKALCNFIVAMPKMVKESRGANGYYQKFPDLLNAINPFMAKLGLKIIQEMQSINGKMYIVTRINHVSGQYIRSVAELPESCWHAGKLIKVSENMQVLGTVLTYTKRYALKSILGIDADDDDDAASVSQINNRK